MPHCVRPSGPVVQQVTVPARPQVERCAHRIAWCMARFDRRPAASAFIA